MLQAPSVQPQATLTRALGDDRMIKITILNETGHTELVMASEEVIEQIDTHPTHWVFINGELVAREAISEVNWDDVEMVDLTPAIVGG